MPALLQYNLNFFFLIALGLQGSHASDWPRPSGLAKFTSTPADTHGTFRAMALTLTILDEQQGVEQGNLFGPKATIHDVVQAKGAKGAVTAAQGIALTPRAPPLSRALAGRMGRQIADTAGQAIVREFEGAAERGYSYSAWCLAGLPHRDLPAGKNWLIETDFARLLIRPGVRLRDDNSEETLRIPMGSFARLLLIDWQTEALEPPLSGSFGLGLGEDAGGCDVLACDRSIDVA